MSTQTLTRRLIVRVEVDDELVYDSTQGGKGTLSRALARRLAQGVAVVQCKGGVRIGNASKICRTCEQAVEACLASAESKERAAVHTFGEDTATGRWLLDRAAFDRVLARLLHEHRHWLWPGIPN